MTDDTQPEAMDLADWLEAVGGGPSAKRCAALLREQHARIAELEAQLEASGFTAADMATAEARGFRDGVASAAQAEGWRPISTAPKDGALIVLGARNGVWLGKYLPVYQSGYRPENPWSSMLLNHDHMAERYTRPTHWMPLPPPPTSAEGVEHG